MQVLSRSQASAPRNRAVSYPDTFFRKIAHRKLADLKHGRIVVRDDVGVSEHGSPSAPPIEVRVDDLSFYRDLFLRGSLGAASAYMDGKWQCSELTGLFALFLENAEQSDGMDHGLARIAAKTESVLHWLRKNTRAGSRRNIREHYDLGNDFFELFLDETMTYSSGIYPDADSTLLDASVNKLDTICRKLQLGPGDHVLETGAGWGSFAIHAAARYGCRVTTTTISDAQFQMARDRIRHAGLDDRIELLQEDYRNLEGEYDKLVSIEMIEAVGHEFLGTYFGQCSRLIRDDGLMLVQVISMPDQRYDDYLKNSDFIQKYVFPGSCCPALGAVLSAVKSETDMKLVHLEDIAPHYARTLGDWRDRFEARLEDVRALGYPERFIRMWRYYLSYCEAGFGQRYISDYQIVFAKPRNRTVGAGHVV